MIITHDREKLLNLIVYFAQNTKNCAKTKLFKLLYYADFRHFKESGKSITGLDYYAWKKGPVPKELYYEIKKPKEDFNEYIKLVNGIDDDSLRIIAKRKFDNKYFTKREIKIIKDVAFIFERAKAYEMVKCTHLPNNPWQITLDSKGESEKIDYTLAFDDSLESLKVEDYKHKIEELDYIKRMLV